jgi:hypothetical protein
MNIMRMLVILVFVAVTPQASIVYSQSIKTVETIPRTQASLVEEFSFLIKDFKMDHQGQANNLNIAISYRYAVNIKKADYPDFLWLAKDVETLLNNYPNEDDYWEIVNNQITALLLKKYPGIVLVTCEIKVDPSSVVPYTRSSRVTRERSLGRSNRKS